MNHILKLKWLYICQFDFFQKKHSYGFYISKKYYICSLKYKISQQILLKDEKDIPTIKKEESK